MGVSECSVYYAGLRHCSLNLSVAITFNSALIILGKVLSLLTLIFELNSCTTTGWSDKIVVLKKTTQQLYFKTFIEKINSDNLIM